MRGLVEQRVASADLIKTSDEVELYDRYHASLAREDFWRFRLFMHRHLIEGWWIKETAYALQEFYEAFKRGERPKMVFESPPQHGKSMTAVDFIAWVAGQDPNLSAIYASYADDLGMKANATLQRLITNNRYRLTFPNTRIVETGLAAQFGLAALRYSRTSSFLEYVGERGTFRNVTINGGVTGQTLDLGVIDDPIKGRAEANSPTIRDKTWDWLTDDFFTRFSETAALLLIATRWHVDDPMSRFLEKFPDARIIRYPAIATKDERNRKKGEPLFPQLKSLGFLNERRKMMTRASFEALYQQSPIVIGGGMFPIEMFRPIKRLNKALVKRSIRFWDKAGTEDGGAYTAGVLMHEMKAWHMVERPAAIMVGLPAEQDARNAVVSLEELFDSSPLVAHDMPKQ